MKSENSKSRITAVVAACAESSKRAKITEFAFL